LAACHVNSLAVADGIGALTVAFPAISTGVYGYPVDQAAHIAVRAVVTANTQVQEVKFVLFSRRSFDEFTRAVERYSS
jgi:O-acetyl-ADP-ribose deacetylase (regulator of RNase III)